MDILISSTLLQRSQEIASVEQIWSREGKESGRLCA